MKKAYLAGPDVFRNDPITHFKLVKEKLSEINIEGLSPFDNECSNSQEIFLSNLSLIRKADFVLANISPFRGPSVDCGTAFEIGYAIALGKPVICYSSNACEYKNRISDNLDEKISYSEFPTVENFGLHENLMIAHSGPVFNSLDEALASVQRDFKS